MLLQPRAALLVAGLALVAGPASADDPWGGRFPERSAPRLPEFRPGGSRGKAERSKPLEISGFAGASLGLEWVRWRVEEGLGAFPRYRSDPPSYPSELRRLPVATFGYDDVPDGTLPACVMLDGGLRLGEGWKLGLRYGYSRTWGTDISVSHHALELTTAIHPFQPWVFVRGSLGRELLIFSDEVGSNLYPRYAWGVGIGGAIRLPRGLRLPIALETSRSFATGSDDGLPSWSTVRFSAGVAWR
jgi:hypothetical protein